MSEKLKDKVSVEAKLIVRNSNEAEKVCVEASADSDCVCVIMWMHTFSPAKMWIRALQALRKPMLHLHTQFNEKLPYDKIDMDFMNLNQSAHGDREFGFICTRLGIKREVVVGYYKNESVIEQIEKFVDVAKAVDFSRGMRVAMFGNNMRDVAVTDGDRVESEIKFGWNVNYYGIGDLCDIIESVTDEEISVKFNEYKSAYEICTDNMDAIREQAKYEVALEKFIKKKTFRHSLIPLKTCTSLNNFRDFLCRISWQRVLVLVPKAIIKPRLFRLLFLKWSEAEVEQRGSQKIIHMT